MENRYKRILDEQMSRPVKIKISRRSAYVYIGDKLMTKSHIDGFSVDFIDTDNQMEITKQVKEELK
jgi:hypothetical protein